MNTDDMSHRERKKWLRESIMSLRGFISGEYPAWKQFMAFLVARYKNAKDEQTRLSAKNHIQWELEELEKTKELNTEILTDLITIYNEKY